tara:strand:- start:2436 stop:2627 length:192 start_codon:yes stop_codon:yes gene_type:complete
VVGISSIDAERIKHINYLMDGLHNRLTNLYEALADKETDQAKQEVKILIEDLKNLHDSLEDDL